jgi:hypothetical protein
LMATSLFISFGSFLLLTLVVEKPSIIRAWGESCFIVQTVSLSPHVVSVTNSLYNYIVVLTRDIKLRKNYNIIHDPSHTPPWHAHEAIRFGHCLLEAWSEEIEGKVGEAGVGPVFISFLHSFSISHDCLCDCVLLQ